MFVLASSSLLDDVPNIHHLVENPWVLLDCLKYYFLFQHYPFMFNIINIFSQLPKLETEIIRPPIKSSKQVT